jgi:alanine racemase
MVSINSKVILENIAAQKAKLNRGVQFCAVLKANAYGMGLLKIAEIIKDYVDLFAVARVADGVKLRTYGIKKPIIILGVCDDLAGAIANDLTVSVTSVAEMRAVCIRSANKVVKIHIKVNTGMNRFGITSIWHLRQILEMAGRNKNVSVDGLYTHLAYECTSSRGYAQTDRQIERFAPFRALFLRSYPRGIISAAYSGNANYKPAQFNMVRIGKSIYGGFEGFKTAVTVTGKIVATHRVRAGETVGYGGNYVCKADTTVGIVNVGYATAGFLLFNPFKFFYVGRVRCKVLGAACMDNVAIDVAEVRDPIGKTVTILGNKKGVRITDFVTATGQSGAKLLCMISPDGDGE